MAVDKHIRQHYIHNCLDDNIVTQPATNVKNFICPVFNKLALHFVNGLRYAHYLVMYYIHGNPYDMGPILLGNYFET